MENTSKILFPDDSKPVWFVALGANWVGPLRAVEVYERVAAGDFSWAHFAWKEGAPSWLRLCDVDVFATAAPVAPRADLIGQIKRAQEPHSSASVPKPPEFLHDHSPEKKWFVFYGDAQYGPYGVIDLKKQVRTLQERKIEVFAWREGLEGWVRAEEIQELAGTPPPAPRAATLGKPQSEKRQAPRRILIARILMINERDSAVSTGICRDVSIGGMQVLTERTPGPVGTKIRLNVSPSVAQDAQALFDPFVATGSVVRVLEDGKGFSFRFDSLSDDARNSIEKYIAQAG